jgi:hypothetical protein
MAENALSHMLRFLTVVTWHCILFSYGDECNIHFFMFKVLLFYGKNMGG